MVTVGRQSGGGLAVKEACSAALPLCPHTAVMKWLHPSCWLLVKNRLIWPLSWWQMGAAASFFSPKRPGPLALKSADWTLSVGGGGDASHDSVQIHREDDVIRYGLLLRELFCYVVAAHEESFHSQICDITNSQNNVSVGLNPFTLGHFVHAMIKSRGDNVDWTHSSFNRCVSVHRWKSNCAVMTGGWGRVILLLGTNEGAQTNGTDMMILFLATLDLDLPANFAWK